MARRGPNNWELCICILKGHMALRTGVLGKRNRVSERKDRED